MRAGLSDPLQCLRCGRPLGPGDFSQPATHSINSPLNGSDIIETAAQFPKVSIVISTLDLGVLNIGTENETGRTRQ